LPKFDPNTGGSIDWCNKTFGPFKMHGTVNWSVVTTKPLNRFGFDLIRINRVLPIEYRNVFTKSHGNLSRRLDANFGPKVFDRPADKL